MISCAALKLHPPARPTPGRSSLYSYSFAASCDLYLKVQKGVASPCICQSKMGFESLKEHRFRIAWVKGICMGFWHPKSWTPPLLEMFPVPRSDASFEFRDVAPGCLQNHPFREALRDRTLARSRWTCRSGSNHGWRAATVRRPSSPEPASESRGSSICRKSLHMNICVYIHIYVHRWHASPPKPQRIHGPWIP